MRGGIVQHSTKPICPWGIFIYEIQDIESHLERQEMDRILNSGRLCNTCYLFQVADIKSMFSHILEQKSLPGVTSSGEDETRVANKRGQAVNCGCSTVAYWEGGSVPRTASFLGITCVRMILVSMKNLQLKYLIKTSFVRDNETKILGVFAWMRASVCVSNGSQETMFGPTLNDY